MSVIIRLQNLPWSANALDIRQYFRGLSIPEGGVHIVGGELGDAFIAFSTDEDARQAFQLNNGKIKEIQIKLLLSSRTEMQKVIEAARTAQTPFMQTVVPPITPTPAIIPLAPIITPVVIQDSPKKDENNKESSKSRERDDSRSRRDRGRRRSRSRSRSRDRKDRSRDRRDRRRRDRSRSRDRRDRRRDRRGRSRSRDRTRSRDRDNRDVRDNNNRDNRRSKDDKKDNKNDFNPDNIKDEKTISKGWEQKSAILTTTDSKQPVGLLGNFPIATNALENARRSLELVSGLQPTNNVPPLGGSNRFPPNDLNNQRGNQDWQRQNRFPDRNESNDPNQFIAANVLGGARLGGMNQNLGNVDIRPHFIPQQPNIRMPLNAHENYSINRPFLSRPGTLFPEQLRQQERNASFAGKNNRNDEQFRRVDTRNQFKPGSTVQIRPYFGGYQEIRKFFQGLYINNTGVKFVTDNGKRTGIAYVRFVRADSKEQAISRTGMILRGVPVEVAHLDDEEYDRYGDEQLKNSEDTGEPRKDVEVTIQSSNQPHHFSCVVIGDLPEFTKEHDILRLFSDYTLLSVHMIVNKQYRQLAYVQFSKEEDANNAISDKTAHVINGKPVTVRPISDEKFADIQRQQTNGEFAVEPLKKEHISSSATAVTHIITDVIFMTGMPHKTSDRDVIDFYSDVGLVPSKIHMLYNTFGPSGECYCEFNNPEEAVCALDKNGMPLGTGTVRVELFPRREMERNLGISVNTPHMNPGGPGPRFQNHRFGPRGPNMMGPRPPPMMRRRMPGPNLRYDGPVEVMGPPGCVVTMENVPFKAGVSEILDFFENFELSNHNVFRRFNDNGAPTGDARVTFNSPVEARRAVEECNKSKIRERTIFLRLL